MSKSLTNFMVMLYCVQRRNPTRGCRGKLNFSWRAAGDKRRNHDRTLSARFVASTRDQFFLCGYDRRHLPGRRGEGRLALSSAPAAQEPKAPILTQNPLDSFFRALLKAGALLFSLSTKVFDGGCWFVILNTGRVPRGTL